jgi:hypothetical protein
MRRNFFGMPPWEDNQEEKDVGEYDVMQVCLNGHKITSSLKSSPELGKKYCSDCGAATVNKCPKCETEIQGSYRVPDIVGAFVDAKVRACCHGCGAPYPWTGARLKAAQELTEETEGLDDQERQMVKASLDDLV